MANVILTSHGSVSLPAPPLEGESPMAEAPDFPRILYSAAEPTGHLFDTQADYEAASAAGPWFKTPGEVTDAATKAPAPPAPSHEAPSSDEGGSAPRSRR